MAFALCFNGRGLPRAHVYATPHFQGILDAPHTIHLYSGKYHVVDYNPGAVRPTAICGWDNRQASGNKQWAPSISDRITDPETGKQVVNCPDCLHPAGPDTIDLESNQQRLQYIYDPRFDQSAKQPLPSRNTQH